MMNLNLEGKTAVVCGSTQGIGKAVALELAELGATVVLVARDEQKLKAVQKELPVAKMQKHSYIIADFTQPEVLKERIAQFVFAQSEVHILVNNTGGPPAGQAIEASLEAFQQAFGSHLICNQILVQALVPLMKKARYGRIVNIISTSVKQPLRGLGVSNTIRGAVANWAKTLSIELAADGITVNNVLPGATRTVRLEGIISNRVSKTGRSAAEVEEEMLSEIPANRFAEAEEVAAAVAFLCTPAAGYINGINVPVDGGRTGCL